MSQVAVLPLLSSTVSCDSRDAMLVFSAMPVKVIENTYSCVAPGSPAMAAVLFVPTELAR